MKLYLVRHGETDVNRILNHGVSGPMHNEQVTFKEGDDTNISLNFYGRSQAQEASQNLPGHIDKIYSSPLLRTKETAEIIASNKNMNPSEISFCNELIEYRQGSLEGLSAEQKNKVAGNQAWGSGLLCTYDYTPWGGDSWKTIYDRLNLLFKELSSNNPGDKVVVCVTSAGVIRMAYKIIFGDKSPEIAKYITIKNGSVHEFIF